MAKTVTNFYSYVLNRAVDITVVLPSVTCPESLGLGDGPASHILKAKFPVLYLLHGFGNNHAQWTGYTNVEMYAEEQRIGKVSTRTDKTRTFKTECSCFGLTHPERFRAIGAFSAATQLNPKTFAENPMGDGGEAEKAYDLHELIKKIKEEGKKFPKIYAACGDKDFLFEADKAFAEELKEAGADVTWKEVAGFGHEWRFWDQQVEQFLDWLPRDDYYAKLGKRSV